MGVFTNSCGKSYLCEAEEGEDAREHGAQSLEPLLPEVSDWLIANKRRAVIGQLCTPGIFNRSSIDSSCISVVKHLISVTQREEM